VTLPKAACLPGADGVTDLPESSWYSVKRSLLGSPLVNEQLRAERLSKPLAERFAAAGFPDVRPLAG
jgi:hypothetical protein